MVCAWVWHVHVLLYLPQALDHHVAERSRFFLCVLLGLHVCSSTAFYTRQACACGGVRMACVWRVHGACITCAWCVHGVCMALLHNLLHPAGQRGWLGVGWVDKPVATSTIPAPTVTHAGDYHQAYVTGSEWDAASQEPFTLSFLAYLVFLFFELASGDMMREAVHCNIVGRHQDGADRLFQEVLDEATAANSSTHFREYRCPAPRVLPAAKETVWSGFRGALFGSNALRQQTLGRFPSGALPARLAKQRRSEMHSEMSAEAAARWRKGYSERADGGPKSGAASGARNHTPPEAPSTEAAGGSKRSSTYEDLSGSLSESLSTLVPTRSMTTGCVDLL